MWAKIGILGPFDHIPDQKRCEEGAYVVFGYVGTKTFAFSSKTKFGLKLAFLVILGQAMQAYSVPCWWVGLWLWRVGCISQDTYLLYLFTLLMKYNKQTQILNQFIDLYIIVI